MGSVREAFAKNLVYHRKRLSLTQAELAERIEMAASYVGHLERGERDPSLLTLEDICKAMNLQPGELFVPREPATDSHSARLQLEELLRARTEDDALMVVRLARAALEHPRLKDDQRPITAATYTIARKPGRRRRPKIRPPARNTSS